MSAKCQSPTSAVGYSITSGREGNWLSRTARPSYRGRQNLVSECEAAAGNVLSIQLSLPTPTA
jgi:hypothetical protein